MKWRYREKHLKKNVNQISVGSFHVISAKHEEEVGIIPSLGRKTGDFLQLWPEFYQLSPNKTPPHV